MGFLLGAFGKLAAGSRYRALQARLMRVQSRLRRATRDVAEMEKALDRQQKAALNSLNLTSSFQKSLIQPTLVAANPILRGALEKTGGFTGSNADSTTLSDAEKKALYDYQMQMNNATMMSEQCAAMQKKQIEDYFEYLRDMQLDPLKDEEDTLQLEKDTLESQLQIAKADYEACQKMEQSDAQMMKPNYTGGQG